MEQYIDKAAIVAEIRKLKDTIPYYSTLAEKDAYKEGIEDAIDKIYSLEVKEVDLDLDEEYKVFVEKDPVYNQLVNGIVGKAIAKHFFELGLKAQKGEKV